MLIDRHKSVVHRGLSVHLKFKVINVFVKKVVSLTPFYLGSRGENTICIATNCNSSFMYYKYAFSLTIIKA